jgi:60 kDa SS-A/Ro ribonucleoprotein
MSNYLAKHIAAPVPQTEQADPSQVLNNAGGYTFQIDKLSHVRRFLILGTEGGTYYAAERKHTLQAVGAVRDAINQDPHGVFKLVLDVSQNNLALKVDPTLLVYALLVSHPNRDFSTMALGHFNTIVRTGSHLLTFMSMVKGQRGWGKSFKRAVAGWYTSKDAHTLMLQLIKYANRQGWTQRDVLRLAKPKPTNAWQNEAFAFAVGKVPAFSYEKTDGEAAEARRMIAAAEELKKVKTPAEAAELITKTGLPHEALLSEHRASKEVWAALLPGLPYHALLRNLSTLGRLGLLDGETRHTVVAKLSTPQGTRVHPMQILLSMAAYKAGKGDKGSSVWPVDSWVLSALSDAFPRAFKEVTPIGQRVLIGLDVSGSMNSPVLGSPITARAATSALASIWAETEPTVEVRAFSGPERNPWAGVHSPSAYATSSPNLDSHFPKVDIAGRRLDDIMKSTNGMPFLSTDCSMPMRWALQKKQPFDLFVVMTDNETYAGAEHPHVSLERYRKEMKLPHAKLVVLATTSTSFTIANPNDPGMMDIAAFSADVPQIIRSFARGEL